MHHWWEGWGGGQSGRRLGLFEAPDGRLGSQREKTSIFIKISFYRFGKSYRRSCMFSMMR